MLLRHDLNKLSGEQLTLNDTLHFKRIIDCNTANVRHHPCDWTVLHFLATSYYSQHFNTNVEELVRYLVCECGVDINVASDYGNTPLHVAMFRVAQESHKSQKYGFVKNLLELKASVDKQNGHGETPLVRYLIHTYHINKAIVWLLLEYGASLPKALQQSCEPSLTQMANGRTAARYAALLVVGIQRYRCSVALNTNNKDVARLIAQLVWQSRVQYKKWAKSL